MTVKKAGRINYFVTLLILLGIIFALAFLSFILITSFPGAYGCPPRNYEVSEIYEFEPWVFEVDGLTAFFPEGGIIVPFYFDGRQEAVLIVGDAMYHSTTQTLPPEKPAGIYLYINHEVLEEKRGDIYWIPVKDQDARAEVLQFIEKQQHLPVVWPGTIPLEFHPRGSAVYYYFLAADGKPDQPPVLLDRPGLAYVSAAIYLTFVIITILVMLVFTLDYQPSRYWKKIHENPPGPIALAAVLGAAGLALGGELLPVLTGRSEYFSAAGYILAALLLILLARLRKIEHLDFGIRPDMLRHGYLIAILVTLLFVVIAREVPWQFSLDGAGSLLDFLGLFFLVAMTREIIWRGFIQTVLGRQFGAVPGLVITVLLAGLVHFSILFVTSPWMLAYPFTWVEIMVLVPGTATVLGLLYQRTENILSVTLLHSLLLFLPRIIVS